MEEITRRELVIGESACLHRTICEAEVYEFAGLTGDYNRIHVDKVFASEQRFGQQIAHGLLVSSLIATVMGLELPGNGCIFLDNYVEFKMPTFFGDTITAKTEFSSYVEKGKCYIGEFKGSCTNQRGEIVCTAVAHQMLPKTHYIIQ